MQWPPELIAVFSQGIDMETQPGLTKEQVILLIFDETARRAVWRANGDPGRLSGCLRCPFTPLGSVVPGKMMAWATRMTLHGPAWGRGVEALHTYLEENASAVCSAFKGEMQPYDDLS
ncbi:MAG: hypothetical protein L0Z62_32955 [Gemmataceae bacterium]|nr:hypothetical protein [Gemmataceae bacterium]